VRPEKKSIIELWTVLVEIASKEYEMNPIERIQQQLLQLPPEKQNEVLDFVSFLQQQVAAARQRLYKRSLRQHPAFGSWRRRQVDALDYQHMLRSEWDQHS